MLKLAGRTTITDFRELHISEITETKKLTHHPFIVFTEEGTDVTVEIVENYSKLMEYPDNTKVMCQWPGQWRSDFFQFCVGNIRRKE